LGSNLNNAIIWLNKILRGRNLQGVAPGKIMVVFSHCLQNSKCSQKIVNDLAECKRCGQCKIKDILDICEHYGIQCAVASGSEMALAKVKSARVEVVVAIACEKELAGGIKALFPKRVVAIPNIRPHGPCKDCSVNINDLNDFLRKNISFTPGA
jgi:hypothetical protein